MVRLNEEHKFSPGKPMKKICLLLLVCLLVVIPLSVEADNGSSGDACTPQASTAARWTILPFIKAYQIYLSPFMITRCPSWPNCSRYASEAVKKHGAAMGAFLAVDRLFHEAAKIQHSPQVFVEGRGYLVYDPLDHNDFWWCKPSQEVKLPDIPQMRQK
jgi:putative component of membrane protein insertase Oxa1/YidC/SpoIIIJ protein YidD